MLIKFRLIIFLLLLSTAIYGQTKVAINTGINFSNISFKKEGVSTFSGVLIPRFNGGIIIQIPLEENWFLYASPGYSGKGTNYGKVLSTGKKDSFKIRLNYVELPISVGYKFPSDNQKNLILSGGIFGGYGFKGKMWITDSPYPPTKQIHRKKTDQYKRLEFGFNISSSYEVNNTWGMKISFSRSMFNIRRSGNERNNVIGFSLFYYLKNNS